MTVRCNTVPRHGGASDDWMSATTLYVSFFYERLNNAELCTLFVARVVLVNMGVFRGVQLRRRLLANE